MFKKSIFVFVALLSFTTCYANEVVETNSKVELEALLDNYRGKVIYLDFWASWCGPCRKSFPWMNEMQRKHSPQGFTVVSVNLDANKSLATKFLEDSPAEFDIVYDAKGKIAKHFAIKGMPSSMMIGRDGEIKSTHTGFYINKTTAYEKEIEALLLLKQ
jgi:thiol-disulfide isomerase/thioredoxin